MVGYVSLFAYDVKRDRLSVGVGLAGLRIERRGIWADADGDGHGLGGRSRLELEITFIRYSSSSSCLIWESMS